jgi:hypothetical protein
MTGMNHSKLKAPITTAEQIDELANKAAERMDALANVVSDHNWLDPRVRHRAVEHVVREVLVDFLLGQPK